MIIGGNYIGKGAEAMMLVVRDQIREKVPEARFWLTPKRAQDVDKLKEDGFNKIHSSIAMPSSDPSLISNNGTASALPFAVNSKFLQGCVKISSKSSGHN